MSSQLRLSKNVLKIWVHILYKSAATNTQLTVCSAGLCPWAESGLSLLSKDRYTQSSGRARSTHADSTRAHYKNVCVYIMTALKLPAKWVLFSIIHLDSTGAKSRSCGFF